MNGSDLHTVQFYPALVMFGTVGDVDEMRSGKSRLPHYMTQGHYRGWVPNFRVVFCFSQAELFIRRASGIHPQALPVWLGFGKL